jgi:hypothetical protein
MNKALGTLQFQLYEYDTKLQDSDANPLPGRLLLGVQLWVALHANSILSAVSAAVESVNKSFIGAIDVVLSYEEYSRRVSPSTSDRSLSQVFSFSYPSPTKWGRYMFFIML